MKLTSAKCWQGKDPLICWQLKTPSFLSESLPDANKIYLTIDARASAKNPINFTQAKPDGLGATGAIINLLRKYARKAPISSILMSENGQILISIGPVPFSGYGIFLEKERPPLLHMIDFEASQSLARVSQNQSFTKKKEIDKLEFEQIFAKAKPLCEKDLINYFKDCLLPITPNTPSTSTSMRENETLSGAQKSLISSLKRRRKTLHATLKKITQRIPDEHELADLEQKANFIKTYVYLIEEGSPRLFIPREMTGLPQDTTVDLDPDIAKSKIVDHFFGLLKARRKSLLMETKQRDKVVLSLQKIEKALEDLSIPVEAEDLAKRREEFKLSKQKPKNTDVTQMTKPYNQYCTSDGNHLWVGKGPKQNDDMTKKARSNDFWVHVTQGSGSHVIVPNSQKTGGQLSEITKKEACILALHFSKFRNDKRGECYVTQKSGIRKTKNLPPGLWLVDRASTFYTTYTDAELKKILDTKLMT